MRMIAYASAHAPHMLACAGVRAQRKRATLACKATAMRARATPHLAVDEQLDEREHKEEHEEEVGVPDWQPCVFSASETISRELWRSSMRMRTTTPPSFSRSNSR
eukprot:6202028-Pleurochrysis_carterae.AAC.1